MSSELGVISDDGDSFESRFCRLVEHQAQNQHQMEVLTTSLTKLIQALDQNCIFVNCVRSHDTQNLIVLPSPPQQDCKQ
ncbi:hypothetical protein MKX03_022976, partial [Papaver bracteatum]